ncbi:unnamed protein product [Amoebophrya sp. A25]|nr:unnamed protein product [Amoebophrya sp. A25]|eukprot:GSA25T00028079001.1
MQKLSAMTLCANQQVHKSLVRSSRESRSATLRVRTRLTMKRWLSRLTIQTTTCCLSPPTLALEVLWMVPSPPQPQRATQGRGANLCRRAQQ